MTFDAAYRGDPIGTGVAEGQQIDRARAHPELVDEHGYIPITFNGEPGTACATCGRMGPHEPMCPNGGYRFRMLEDEQRAAEERRNRPAPLPRAWAWMRRTFSRRSPGPGPGIGDASATRAQGRA